MCLIIYVYFYVFVVMTCHCRQYFRKAFHNAFRKPFASPIATTAAHVEGAHSLREPTAKGCYAIGFAKGIAIGMRKVFQKVLPQSY